MEFLKRFRGKRKVSEDFMDAEKMQLVNDAEKILGILKSSMNFSAMSFDELKFRFYRLAGISSGGEERILRGLKLLADSKIIAWAGSRANDICFMKSTLPTRLMTLKFEGVLNGKR